MRKQTITKIIGGMIIFVFVVSFFQFALPIQATTTTNLPDLYSNPNQTSAKNPYKFTLASVLKSGILQNVIGCTGVVNKVATWMSTLLQSPAQIAKTLKAKKDKIKEQLTATCLAVKAGAQIAGQIIPSIGGLAPAIDTAMAGVKIDGVEVCKAQAEVTVDKMTDAQIEANEREAANTLKDQCFDGIAIMLAKNQLTSMTRSAMNWVNTGYGGNPFFVQNVQNFANKLEQNVVETGIDILLTPKNQNPYASDFVKSVIASRGIGKSFTSSLFNLKSDLGAFITDPQSYYTEEHLSDAEKTQMALRRAQGANNAFANDFSVGGWDGWLALTQRDQNNPLGFTMLASQYLEEAQTQAVAEKKDELLQNNGFLSQKKCVLWQVYGEDHKPKYEEGGFSPSGLAKSSFTPITQKTKPSICYKSGGECCVEWEVVTPGSIIKEQTANYLASPQRQLELVKTINDGINALFSYLISELENAGLSGLSDSVDNPANFDDNTNFISSDGNTPYDNNGAYDGFNLTRDLGNTYIHTTPIKLGNWHADTNATDSDYDKDDNYDNGKLYQGEAPIDIPSGKSAVDSYYTVTIAGKTELLLDGYNGWNEGDRAFWDGSEWQNWKKDVKDESGVIQKTNPIKKRGVIQIQQDYIVAATEILKVLPSVMTKLGELDYCIPGPNPSYLTNSTDAQSAYQDWVGSLYVGPIDAARQVYTIDHPGERTYDNLANIFTDSPSVWKTIKNSMDFLLENFDSYKYITGNIFSGSNKKQKIVDKKRNLMDVNMDYANSSLFQNFYENFDKMMNKLYFNNMTSMYNEYENRSITLPTTNSTGDKNLGYIPMAESGLDLTKNIMYYAEDIAKVTQEYSDDIAIAKVNIAKLEPIKAEVSKIIKDAQDRRDKRLLEIVNKEMCNENYTKCMQDGFGLTGQQKSAIGNRGSYCNINQTTCNENEKPVTDAQVAQYKEKYKECLAEENMNFYDADTIMNIGGADAERCFNGIDDDLDGLIDTKDPDCFGVTPVVHCVRSGISTPYTGRINAGSKCSDITDSQSCSLYHEYESNLAWQCEWK
ncbi:MAG: hypothetical protein WC908_02355 [Candidatus Paceibacterota bacterium]